MYKAFRIIVILFLVAAFLAMCLVVGGCSAKKKLSDRSNKTEKTFNEFSVTQLEQKAIDKDCTAVKTVNNSWKHFFTGAKLEPKDPAKPSSASITKQEDGSLLLKSNNGILTFDQSSEENIKQEKDSVDQSFSDDSKKDLQNTGKTSGESTEDQRKTKTFSIKPSTIWLGFGIMIIIVFGLLVYFKGWNFWRKPKK